MRKFAAFILYVLALLATPSQASEDSKIYIDVGQAQLKKSLLALPPLQYIGSQATNSTHINAGQTLFRVINNDLTVSGFFQFVAPDAYLEDPAKIGLRPAPATPNGFNFKNWQTIGTEFLVRAAYNIVGSDVTLETYVYHVPTAKVVLGRTYKGGMTGLRKIGHTFANDLVKALTGKRGMFISKLVASRQETPGRSAKEIYVLEWDGANAQKITANNSIALSPNWSTRGDKVAYTLFAMHKANKVRNADLFVYELATGKRFLTSYRKGINSGAAFLPGDLDMLLTLSVDGTADIFRMSADGQNVRPLTRGPSRALNVEPAVSPDGKTVAFSSDRAGRPHVFLMNIDGSNVRRLTFAGKYNASPAWSPDGKMIAFAGDDSGHFDIFVVNANGTGLRRLTDARKPNGKAANNESPSWSPDGRHIVFSSDRTGSLQLFIVSPEGTNERRITEDNFNWDKPKWSPFLD